MDARTMQELRYDGPIPVFPPITPATLERQRRDALDAAAHQDDEADECDRRAAVHTARSKVENNCKWRLRQAAQWHDEARRHRQIAADLRESAARLSSQLNELMAETCAHRAAAQ